MTNGLTEVDYDTSPYIQYKGVIGICCEAMSLETDVRVFCYINTFPENKSHTTV